MKTRAARLNKFWWWIKERHKIYEKRKAGEPWPWTRDKIMRDFAFTNVFRELDRVTLEFHERIDHLENSPDKLFRMILFRAFNLASTYDLLTKRPKTLDKTAQMKKVLHRSKDKGNKIFTGAYIITNAGRSESKIDVMCDALSVIRRGKNRIFQATRDDGTMKGCTAILTEYPMMGAFTSYEVVCDMRYQKGMLSGARDKKLWANPGPGARRGINYIVSGAPKDKAFANTEMYVSFMRQLLIFSAEALPEGFPKLEMREIEHSLCEYSKYCNAVNGKRLKRRYRYEP